MAAVLLAVDATANAADIRNARESADREINERRTAVARALRRINDGDRLTAVLDELALGMYLTGHLEAGCAARKRHAQEAAANALLAEENRRLVRRQPTPKARAR